MTLHVQSCFEDRNFSNQASNIFSVFLIFSKEEKGKIEKERNSRIYENVSSSLESEYLSEQFESLWKDGKNKQSNPYRKKY